MTTAGSSLAPSAILCADWGKDGRKRTVYVADVGRRSVRRVSASRGWSLSDVLAEAERWTLTGAVLATFDVPLGVPESYLAAVRTVMPGEPPATFLDLLAGTRAMPRFFDATADARDWSVERPFFAVPTGAGGLRSYLEAAAQRDVDLYRRIDRLTGAKAVFIRSGVPGSVGSAACALWQELAPYVGERRAFSVWPFEGHLEALLRSTSVVVGEIYPRAAYATALLDVPPASRAPLVVAKTDAKVRAAALAVLRATRWVASLDVTLEHLSEAEANEDDFDACLTAAALLRCVLDGSSLCPADLDLPESEGGILGTGSVNLHLPARQFTGPDTPVKAGRGNHTDALERPGPVRREIDSRDGRSGERTYRCPIEGCQKFFRGSRGGWDAHVASLPSHPAWHPELKDAEERKRRFREEFPGFFS